MYTKNFPWEEYRIRSDQHLYDVAKITIFTPLGPHFCESCGGTATHRLRQRGLNFWTNTCGNCLADQFSSPTNPDTLVEEA